MQEIYNHSSELSSISRVNHRKDIDKNFGTYQEYADDISAITTEKNTTEHNKQIFTQNRKRKTFIRMNQEPKV